LERANLEENYKQVKLYGDEKLKTLNGLEIAKLLKYVEAKRNNFANECSNRALFGDFEYPLEYKNDWIGYWKSITGVRGHFFKLKKVTSQV
jgi:hypothetical protein